MNILDRIAFDGVFSIRLLQGNKIVRIQEEMDECKGTELNYAEFCQLISELTGIAKRMLVSINDDDPDFYTTFPD